MARIFVHAADLTDGRITRMQVKLGGLPPRTIDRDTALSWMKDMHSFVPVLGGDVAAALQLVEVVDGEEVSHFIRVDNAAESADSVPEKLPSCGS